MNSSEIRAKARENLKENYGLFLLISFIAILITGAVSEFFLLGIIVSGPIAVGLAYVFIRLTRKQEVKVENLFFGFNNLLSSFVEELLRVLFTMLWTLLFIVPGIIKALSYSMAPYILSDNPEMSGLDAINKSKAMMKGQKGRLFALLLSFIGWFFLALLTCGIGFIFLAPYVSAAQAEFYQDLLDQKKAV